MFWHWGSKLVIIARYTARTFNFQTQNKNILSGYINHCSTLVRTARVMSTATHHSGSGGHTNRLANEKSPYLLQHADNPVDWYPWGEEAFEKARREEKLIFLSVGYSTCHWCHVMERESFSSEVVGQILNEHFVSIKVDREERPDVDRVYMAFVQATSGSGGWPMNVWLTPDLKPIVGGTYFPPNDRHYGRPGFASVLQNIAKQWQENRAAVKEQSTVILDALTEGISLSGGSKLPIAECLDLCYTRLSKTYDDEYGGFGSEPKFPQPVNFNFLFRLYALKPTSSGGKQGLDMSLHTLKCMAYGGIRDHIAQGFHRYSTDNHWHVPHFEKMLYDQAQLARSYLDAYQISKDEFYADVARSILEYISNELNHPSGGFHSAEDADSLPTHDAKEKREGAFCVWTESELRTLLNKPVEGHASLNWADVFIKHYQVNKLGNVDPYKDVHKELSGKNILFMKCTEAETATSLNLDASLVSDILQHCRQLLLEVRQKRPKPHKDTKIVVTWNGLMISAYARAAQVLQDSTFLDRAIKGLNFIKSQLYLPEKKLLLHSCYCDDNGELSQINNPVLGFAEDYAYIIQALLDTYEACLDESWLEWAEELQTKQDRLFLDTEKGGYFTTTTDDSSIVLRLKEDQDGAEPSANSISANNLTRLANYLPDSQWDAHARHLLTFFHDLLTKVPIAMPEMVCALIPLYFPAKQIVIVGPRDREDTLKLVQAVHSLFIPNKVLIINDKNNPGFLSKRVKTSLPDTIIDDKATANVCLNKVCLLPVTSPEDLVNQLKT